MSKSAVLVLIALALPLSATTLNYDFTSSTFQGTNTGNSWGNYRTYTNFEASEGVTARAYAFSTTGTGNALETARLFQWTTYAHGICNQEEQTTARVTTDCGLPVPHQIDNLDNNVTGSPSGGANNVPEVDFLVIQFDSTVVLDQLTINPYGATTSTHYDRDVTYFFGTTTYGNVSSLTGSTLDQLVNTFGFVRVDADADPATSGNSQSNDDIRTIILPRVAVNTIIIGARAPGINAVTGLAADGTPDQWKTNQLQVITTPEPSTFALVGLALAGLGYFGKRRR